MVRSLCDKGYGPLFLRIDTIFVVLKGYSCLHFPILETTFIIHFKTLITMSETLE